LSEIFETAVPSCKNFQVGLSQYANLEQLTLMYYLKIYQLIAMCFRKTYFGLKLHDLVTIDGFVTDFLLTAANLDDRDDVFELV